MITHDGTFPEHLLTPYAKQQQYPVLPDVEVVEHLAPHVDIDHSTYRTALAMLRGEVKGFFLPGENPAVGSANGKLHRMALASLDPALVLGDRRVRLATHEWTGSVVDPTGYTLLERFDIIDGVPVWRWRIGDVVWRCGQLHASGEHGRLE